MYLALNTMYIHTVYVYMWFDFYTGIASIRYLLLLMYLICLQAQYIPTYSYNRTSIHNVVKSSY